jgi:hypothetical protein
MVPVCPGWGLFAGGNLRDLKKEGAIQSGVIRQ